MLKNYVLSFLAMKFYPMLLAPSLMSFALVLVSLITHTRSLKPVAAVLAVLLALVLVYYNLLKMKLSRKCRKVENAREYDDAVMLGFNFLCEERMIAYENRDIKEFYYKDLIKITAGMDKKGMPTLELQYPEYKAVLPTGSQGQAERTAAFLCCKAPSALLEGIEAKGNGRLHSIDNTEK